jgi:hypothetical protein
MSEEVIGTAGEKNEYNLLEAHQTSINVLTVDKNIHCIAGYKTVGDPVEMLKDRCGNDCECKCRHSYLARMET